MTHLEEAERGTADPDQATGCAFEHAPVPMAVLDPDGALRSVNAALAALLGMWREGLTGTSFAHLVHPEDSVAVARAVEEVIHGQATARALMVQLVSAVEGAVVRGIRLSRLPDGGAVVALIDPSADGVTPQGVTSPSEASASVPDVLVDTLDLADLRTAAAEADLPDVLVFQRVAAQRWAHIGGVGRGEGWAGIVEVDLAAAPELETALHEFRHVSVGGQESVHVIGPYYARRAVVVRSGDRIVVLGNQQDDVALPTPERLDALVQLAVNRVTIVSPAKSLADELELLEAVHSLLHYQGWGVHDALSHLLRTVIASLSCDAGLAWREGTEPVGEGLDLPDTTELVTALAAEARSGSRCEQRPTDDHLGTLLTGAGVRSFYLVPLDHHGGFVFVAHTDAGPRGFTSLCQRLGQSLVSAAGLLFDAAATRQRLQEEAARATIEARTDTLTGVGNRLTWNEALEALDPEGGAVLIVDVNRLKSLNDLHGHAVGDRALQATARLLVGEVGDRGIVARVGGDEFAILLPGCDDGEARRTSRRIEQAAERAADGAHYHGVSIGHAAAPRDGIRDAIGRADAAMYADKRDTV